MPLYNIHAYGLPRIPLSKLADLTLSDHAKTRATQRGIPLSLLATFDPVTYPVFQMETARKLGGGESVLILNWRKRFDARHDLCACINPTQRKVISCWLNDRTFRPTVDRTPYARPIAV